MKRIVILFCIAAGAAFAARAQQVIKSGGLADFAAVNFSGKMSVEMISADSSAVEIELHGLDSNRVTWGVAADSVLNVRLKPSASKSGTMLVRVFYRSVNSLRASVADVRADGPLSGTMLSAQLSDGARFTAQLECVDARVEATGNSAALLTGKAEYLCVEADQRSVVDGRALESLSAEVRSRLGSEVFVWGVRRVVSQTSTGGAVFYRGAPHVLRVANSLGGTTDNIGN